MSDKKRQRPDVEDDDEAITLSKDETITSKLYDFRSEIYTHKKTLTQTLTELSNVPTEVQKLTMSYAKSIFTKPGRLLIDKNSRCFEDQTDLDSYFEDIASMLGGYMEEDPKDCILSRFTGNKPKFTEQIRSLIDEYSISFQNQTQLNSCLKDVASILGVSKQKYDDACEKEGVVKGQLTFEYNGDLIDCMKAGIQGIPIPSNISRVEISSHININYSPTCILLVEKDAVYMSLAKDKYYDRFRCIIVKTGKGQSGYATRLFVRKCSMALNLPVFALVDSDSCGLKVLFDYALTTPHLKWLGFRPSDLDKYKIPEECRWLMTEKDIKTTEDLLKEDFVKKNALWVEELNLMLRMKQKVVLQSLTTFDFDYLAKLYVPWKLQDKDWL